MKDSINVVPVYRAKRKNFDETVVGNYMLGENSYTGKFPAIITGSLKVNGKVDNGDVYEIDISTLEIAFVPSYKNDFEDVVFNPIKNYF